MKVSYNWLKDYVSPLPAIDELSIMLTDIGLEVDGIEKAEAVRGGLEGVVVGEVLTCDNHADSDHLHVTSVNTGGEAPLQIVCGAPNVAAGQKVMVATINTVLYPNDAEDGFKIKKSKIRGVESFGMICAEDELGIGESHDGIMVLDAAAVPGTPAKEYLGISDDYTIEIGLTPNRVDAASHYGVARDLYAYLKTNGHDAKLSLPPVDDFKEGTAGKGVAVKVENTEAAPRYAGLTIEGVTVAPSPEWLQKRLRAIGITPKNNVVDATNYVLHETGQPLHAFDAGKIGGGQIVVRTCPEGTKFTTLDGVERTLSDRDLMICDAQKPMCIAGVLGGQESGVSDATQTVFLESAYFNPVWIRKSAKRHGLNTDASFRFERGIDPNITIYALKRAALLIREMVGGQIASTITDICDPEITQPFVFDLSLRRLTALVGKEIPEAKVREILASLDVKVLGENDGVLNVAVPPFRVDVRREADLIEDILRIYGYNNVEISDHMSSSLSYQSKPNKQRLTNVAADWLSARGFNEIMSNSLTKGAYYEGLASYKPENCVKMLNPLSNDLNVMRQTLLFNTMEAVALNTNHRNPNLRFYEFGNVYSYSPEKAQDGGLAPYRETYRLSIALTGLETAASWNTKATPGNFFHLKAEAEKLLARFGVNIYDLQEEPSESDLFDEAVTYKLNGKELFTMGIVAGRIKALFDLSADVFFLELNFEPLMKAAGKVNISLADLPKFPEVRRDLALLIDKSVRFADLRRIAFATEKKFLRSISLFDVYVGDKLPEGKKSYALSFTLLDESKTMNDQMIDRIMGNLMKRFEQEAGAQVRA